MEYDLLETQRETGHVHVELANPAKPNPINGQVQTELNAVLDTVESTPEIDIVSFTGQGTAFAVGADVEEIYSWVQNDEWGRLMHFLRDGQLLMNRIAQLSVPTIAGINGYALGGGLELALACDIRFAAETAELGFPEINLGMIPGWGGTQRLPEVVDRSTAKDLLLTGKRIDAETAGDVGLVDKVVDEERLDDAVDEYAQELAEKPSETMQYLLAAVRASEENPLDGGLSYELMCDMFATFTDDANERLDEFVNN